MSFEQITIVGGRGFVGRALVKTFEKKGAKVVVPERLPSGEEPLGLLIWAAGYTSDYAADPAATVNAHASDLARTLADSSYDAVIYLSSTRLYDGLEEAREDMPLSLDPGTPRHLYDLSKALGEWLVRHQAQGRSHVLRLSGVYGDALDGGSFLETVIERALEGKGGFVDVPAQGARDYVHLDDVCRAVVAVADGGVEPVYNVASGEVVDNETLLALLSARTDTPFEARPEAPDLIVPDVDISRLKALGLTPRSLSEGLDHVLTWQHNQRAMRSMLGVDRMPWM